VFNAVIFKRHFQHFPDARSWEFKIIEVRGKIQLYQGKGKPEIILERQEQVSVDSSTTPPQGGVPQGMEAGVEGSVVRGVPPGGIGAVVGGTATGPVMDYDQAPRPIKITRPQYPHEAFINKIEGTVIVEILIDSTGRVVRARVIQSVPLLDAAALQTVWQWAFSPAIKRGRPVPTLAHAPISFRIYEKAPRALEQRKQSPATSGKK
jgi:TonB family protein